MLVRAEQTKKAGVRRVGCKGGEEEEEEVMFLFHYIVDLHFFLRDIFFGL